MKKLIDLTPECVRQLNIEAAKKGTNAKNLIESIIEREAVVSGWAMSYRQSLLKVTNKKRK